MVTIEQKLSLFSKLLQQDIKNEISGKLALIEEEYQQKQKEHNDAVDKEARLIVDKAIKKAEIKKTEMVSKARMQAKKQAMISKEKCVNLCMNELKEHVSEFVKSKDYKAYLLKKIQQIGELDNVNEAVIIYMTKEDNIAYGQIALEQLEIMGLSRQEISLQICEMPILGGLIVEVPSENIRMDLSIMTIIEDHRALIVERVFEAIEQVGEISE